MATPGGNEALVGQEGDPDVYPPTPLEVVLSNQTAGSESDMFRYGLDELSLSQQYLLFLSKLRALKNEYRHSEGGKAMAKMLQDKILPRQDIEVCEAVCLGLASLQYENMENSDGLDFGTREWDQTVLAQLAAFICWIDILKTRFTIQRICVQGPGLTEKDANLLIRLLGITTLESGTDCILGGKSFLFSIDCPAQEVLLVLAEFSPVLYIGRPEHKRDPQSGNRANRRNILKLLQQPDVRAYFEARASSVVPLVEAPDRGFDLLITIDDSAKLWKLQDLCVYWKAGSEDVIDSDITAFYAENKLPDKANPKEDGDTQHGLGEKSSKDKAQAKTRASLVRKHTISAQGTTNDEAMGVQSKKVPVTRGSKKLTLVGTITRRKDTKRGPKAQEPSVPDDTQDRYSLRKRAKRE